MIFAGPPQEIESCEASLTGQYLSGKRKVEVPEARRKGNGKFLEIRGASQNNLQNVNVKIPLGEFVCVTGVSGSGKSSLINEILYKKLAAELNRAHTHPGKHKEIRGLEHLDKVIQIDQSPHWPHAPLQPGHLHRAVQRHPGAVRLHPGRENAGLYRQPLLL